ncbi:MAG: MerR family transcriptional regulator [Pseudonocardiales bacterium]|nr:MAG: MerR family transcriptional regulator [Pseudonocardiales bacterium]
MLAQLRTDFPDVTISKIRFLESEGLVQPERSAAGYRQFSLADIHRLRYVLAAQRDHYLPLRVIKEHLDALDRGGSDGMPERHSDASWPRSVPGRSENLDTVDTTRITQEELLALAGIGRAALTELEQFGLVRPGPAGFYDTDAVLVAKTARAMTDFGLEPRHLRSFRASADREVGLLAQIVTPMSRQRDPDARARAEEAVRELAVLSLRLHALLVKIGLRGVIGN